MIAALLVGALAGAGILVGSGALADAGGDAGPGDLRPWLYGIAGVATGLLAASVGRLRTSAKATANGSQPSSPPGTKHNAASRDSRLEGVAAPENFADHASVADLESVE